MMFLLTFLEKENSIKKFSKQEIKVLLIIRGKKHLKKQEEIYHTLMSLKDQQNLKKLILKV